MRIHIKRASILDAENVVSLFRSVVGPLTVYNEAARRAEIEKYNLDRVQAIIADNKAYVGIALINDHPAGFSIAEPDGDLWWFAWFGVLPSERGHQLGRMLVQDVLETARKRSLRKVWCDSRKENVRSIAILEAAGFNRICSLPDHWFGQDYILWQINLF